MPQSKEIKTEQARLRMQKMRNKGVTVDPEGVTLIPANVTVDVTQYPAILLALTDPDKRKKLEKIYHSLNEFKVADKVYYGCGKDSVPFDVVGDLLEATR